MSHSQGSSQQNNSDYDTFAEDSQNNSSVLSPLESNSNNFPFSSTPNRPLRNSNSPIDFPQGLDSNTERLLRKAALSNNLSVILENTVEKSTVNSSQSSNNSTLLSAVQSPPVTPTPLTMSDPVTMEQLATLFSSLNRPDTAKNYNAAVREIVKFNGSPSQAPARWLRDFIQKCNHHNFKSVKDRDSLFRQSLTESAKDWSDAWCTTNDTVADDPDNFFTAWKTEYLGDDRVRAQKASLEFQQCKKNAAETFVAFLNSVQVLAIDVNPKPSPSQIITQVLNGIVENVDVYNILTIQNPTSVDSLRALLKNSDAIAKKPDSAKVCQIGVTFSEKADSATQSTESETIKSLQSQIDSLQQQISTTVSVNNTTVKSGSSQSRDQQYRPSTPHPKNKSVSPHHRSSHRNGSTHIYVNANKSPRRDKGIFHCHRCGGAWHKARDCHKPDTHDNQSRPSYSSRPSRPQERQDKRRRHQHRRDQSCYSQGRHSSASSYESKPRSASATRKAKVKYADRQPQKNY